MCCSWTWNSRSRQLLTPKKSPKCDAQIRVSIQIQQILAAAPYVIGGCAITLLGDELPRLHDAPPRRFAVKAHQHEPAGTQQR